MKPAKWLVAPLVAPLTVWLVWLIAELVTWAVTGSRSTYFWSIKISLQGLVVVAYYGVPFAYAAALLIGAPGVALLRRAGRESARALAVLGAIAGCTIVAVGVLFDAFSAGADRVVSSTLWALGLFAPAGAAAALVFWYMDPHPTRTSHNEA